MFKNWGFFVKPVREKKEKANPDGYVSYNRLRPPPKPSDYSSSDPIDLEDLIKQIETSAIKVIVVYFSASTLRGTILALVRARTNPF